jgi:catechol 2,3-dioxygenase-like lactoylglutathione lyase family enzyme
MAIFTHVMVGTNDLNKAKTFFNATLAPLGVKNLGDMTDHSTMYGDTGPEFMVTTPANGEAACHANGGTIGFQAPSRAAVHAFHEAALANGGTCEGEPGPRPFSPTAYAAYVRDPDGNKICTFCFAPE